MRKQIITEIILLNMVWGLVCLQACQQPAAKPGTSVKHMGEVHRKGVTFYIDPPDSRCGMRTDTGGSYFAYKIGYVDSGLSEENEQEWNVYFYFRMMRDWKAVVGKDSIKPVRFKPLTGLNGMKKEGLIVFKLPTGKHPDALVYKDSFANSQRQIIALKPHVK